MGMFTNLLVLRREKSLHCCLQLACRFLVYQHDIQLIYRNLLETEDNLGKGNQYSILVSNQSTDYM